MKLSTNRKILAIGALILLACLVVSLTPWYRDYTAADDELLCAKYRKLIEVKYQDLAYEQSASESEEALVEKAIEAFYIRTEYTVDAADGKDNDLTIDGLCPRGGQYTVCHDDQAGITVSCSENGHDRDYIEYGY